MNEEVTADEVTEEVTDEVKDAVVAEEVEEVTKADADAETEETPETEDGEAEVKAEKPEPSESSPEKKKTDGFQKRIDELTKLRRDQERETVYWKELAQKEQVAPEPVSVPGKTLADFEYDEGKFAEYLKTEAKADAVAEVDKRLLQERQARSMADFSAIEAEFSKDVDDYHIVTRNNDLKITNDMLAVAQDSPDGAAVLYYFGKNPEVAERLANLSPMSMAREIGKIEATELKKEKPQSISKAPKPVPKLEPTDSKVTIDPMKMSDSQFSKWRQKAIANR